MLSVTLPISMAVSMEPESKLDRARNSFTFAVEQLYLEEQKLKSNNFSDDNVGKPGKVRNFEGFTSEMILSSEDVLKRYHSLHTELIYDTNLTEIKALLVYMLLENLSMKLSSHIYLLRKLCTW